MRSEVLLLGDPVPYLVVPLLAVTLELWDGDRLMTATPLGIKDMLVVHNVTFDASVHVQKLGYRVVSSWRNVSQYIWRADVVPA